MALSRHKHRPRRVVAIDLRGRGLSDRDKDWRRYEPRIELADVVDQLAALGVAHAVIVGTSRGGLIAMGMGAVRPGLLRGVVLNDVGPVIEAQGLIRIRSYVGKLPPPRSMDEAVDILRRISDARFPALSDDDWLTLARGSWVEKDGKLVPSYDTELFRGLAALDLEAPLPPIWPYFDSLKSLPILAIRGENSDLLSPGTLDAMAQAHAGLETLTVPARATPLSCATPPPSPASPPSWRAWKTARRAAGRRRGRGQGQGPDVLRTTPVTRRAQAGPEQKAPACARASLFRGRLSVGRGGHFCDQKSRSKRMRPDQLSREVPAAAGSWTSGMSVIFA